MSNINDVYSVDILPYLCGQQMVSETSIEKLIQSCGTQAGIAIANQTIIGANQSFANILGYTSPQTFIGAALLSIIVTEDILSPGIHHILAVSATGLLSDLEATLIQWPDTSEVWLVLIREWPKLPDPIAIGNTNSPGLIAEYYRGIIEDQTDLVDRFLPDGTITYANQALCRFFKRSQKELIGWSFYEQLSNEDRQHLIKLLSTISPDNLSIHFEHKITTMEGDERWMHWTNRGIFDSKDNLMEYLAFGQDITEAHNAEEARADSERLFQAAFENAGVGMLLLTSDGLCIKSNHYAQDLSGYSAEEMNHLSSIAIDPGLGNESCVIADLVRDMVSGEEDIIQTERRCTTKSGKSYWARISISAVRDKTRKLVYIIVALADTTEFRDTLISLKDAEQFSRTVIRAAGEGIIVYDRERNILVWNRKMEETFNISSEDAIGKSVPELLPFFANNLELDNFQNALNGITTRNIERVYDRPGINHREYVAITFSPHYNSSGEVIGVIQITRDITSAKQAEIELHKTMQDLEKSYQLQKDFLNNVTHDVRTPLTAVQGYVKMLMEGIAGEITEFQSQLLQKVLISSDQLLDMVNCILETNKSRNGKLSLLPSACKPDVILSGAVSSISPQAEEKNLAVTFNRIECRTGLYDQQKLTMILLNILGNAVKFTEYGSIETSIIEDEKGVEITIIDTGVGIDKTRLPNIFDEFVQLESPRKHKHPGFGLGLSIVANMIELMHGCIVVSSEAGIGTAFTIKIPWMDSV